METLMHTTSMGAELLSFKIDGMERIHQGKNVLDDNGKIYYEKNTTLMFPIVGKLKSGTTMINGRIYDIPVNGFARKMEFEPITKLDNFHSYKLVNNKFSESKYPFEFELINTYRTEENKLIFIQKIKNTGPTKLPFGLGMMPAFSINLEDLLSGYYYLEFEEEEESAHFLYLIDGLIGAEYSKKKLIEKKIILLDRDTFKDDALIIKGVKNKRISLKNARTKKTELILYYEGWPYLNIWSKTNAPFICLSPCFSTSDRINKSSILKQKTDIISLDYKEEFEAKFSVQFF